MAKDRIRGARADRHRHFPFIERAVEVTTLLERQTRAELDFAAWRHRHGDCAELRFVYVTVGRSEVDLVQRIEGFAAELECRALRDSEAADNGDIHSLQRRSVNRVASHVTERV